jgi:hypothetical protein
VVCKIFPNQKSCVRGGELELIVSMLIFSSIPFQGHKLSDLLWTDNSLNQVIIIWWELTKLKLYSLLNKYYYLFSFEVILQNKQEKQKKQKKLKMLL